MSVVQHHQCPICSKKELKSVFKGKDHSHTGEEFEVVQCSSCHFVFTQGVPDEQHIGPYYQSEDYVSHSDTQKGLFFKVYHWVRNYMLKQKANMVEKHSTKGKLLDIGTGTGYFPATMKTRGWECVGIEQDENARKLAQEKGFDVYGPTHLKQLENNSFSAISLWHVLEHLHQLDESIDEMKRVLTANGSITIAVPNHDSHDGKYYGKYWAAWDLPIHLWHFTPNSMQELAKKHQLEIVKHYRLPFDSFYVSILSEKYKKGSAIKGLWVGFISYLKSLGDPKKCSSVVYVLKKSK